MARSAQLGHTNAITGIFCLLRVSVQGRSVRKAQGELSKPQPLLSLTARPDLATSLSGNTNAKEIYTGLQKRASQDPNELSWLGYANFCGERILFFANTDKDKDSL